MTASQSMGSVRHRAHVACPFILLPAAARPPECWESPRTPRAPSRIDQRAVPCAQTLEPRTLLATFTVTTPADAGPGSLRQAILDANTAEGADEIHFALPGTAGTVHTIQPLSKFPDITGPTTLDATTQPGYAGTPVVELDGSAAGVDIDGITVRARHSQVRGLVINRFSRHGIVIDAPPTTARPPGLVSVDGCRIGTDPGGNVAQPNGGAGIVVKSVITLIGGPLVTQRNLISGNRLAGVWASAPSVPGRDGVAIKGNYVGTNAAGDAAVPNGSFGILVDTGAPLVRNNLISGNAVSGVHSTGATANPSISENLIGTDASGTRAIANGSAAGAQLRGGVTLSGGASGWVSDNIISGNYGAGVRADHSEVRLNHNAIGTNRDHTLLIPNEEHGINATGGPLTYLSSNTIVGHSGDGVRVVGATKAYISSNRILRNRGDGVRLVGVLASATDPSRILRNRIEGSMTDASPLPASTGNGITLEGCRNVDVGGPGEPDGLGMPYIGSFGNSIDANPGHGVAVVGVASRTDSSGIFISGNRIGFLPFTLLPAPNGGSGIHVVNERGVAIGLNRRGIPTGNAILFNRGAGISLAGSTSESRISGNLIADNTGPGIDLGGDGVTPNDRLDVDTGANRLQNFPVVTGVSPYVQGVSSKILFTLDAAPNTTYVVEVFGSLDPGAQGYGRATMFFGAATVRTDAKGHVEGSTSAYPVPGRAWFTATATDGRGNTSELSPALAYRRPRDSFRPPARRSAVLVPVVSLGRAVVRRDAPIGRGLLG